MTTFAYLRMLAELRWHTRLICLKYRVHLPPRYLPTGRVINGRYAEVRRVP